MTRSSRRALEAAAALAGAAAVVWVLAFRTAAGARIDEDVLSAFLDSSRPGSHALASAMNDLADPRPVALFTAGIVGVALVRRRWRLALAASVAIAGANLTTQALKVLTAEPRAIDAPGAHVAAESWPSGHATASMILVLCLVVVAPERLRPLAAALGGAAAVGVACSVLLLGWHLPSDVAAGFCVAAAWALGAFAILGRRSGEASASLSAAKKAVSRVSGRQAAGERGTQ